MLRLTESRRSATDNVGDRGTDHGNRERERLRNHGARLRGTQRDDDQADGKCRLKRAEVTCEVYISLRCVTEKVWQREHDLADRDREESESKRAPHPAPVDTTGGGNDPVRDVDCGRRGFEHGRHTVERRCIGAATVTAAEMPIDDRIRNLDRLGIRARRQRHPKDFTVHSESVDRDTGKFPTARYRIPALRSERMAG